MNQGCDRQVNAERKAHNHRWDCTDLVGINEGVRRSNGRAKRAPWPTPEYIIIFLFEATFDSSVGTVLQIGKQLQKQDKR
jgi:hypothetical protein